MAVVYVSLLVGGFVADGVAWFWRAMEAETEAETGVEGVRPLLQTQAWSHWQRVTVRSDTGHGQYVSNIIVSQVLV